MASGGQVLLFIWFVRWFSLLNSTKVPRIQHQYINVTDATEHVQYTELPRQLNDQKNSILNGVLQHSLHTKTLKLVVQLSELHLSRIKTVKNGNHFTTQEKLIISLIVTHYLILPDAGPPFHINKGPKGNEEGEEGRRGRKGGAKRGVVGGEEGVSFKLK